MAATGFTKAQIRSMIRQAIDDPSSARWADANLDLLTTMVQDTMFQSILDTFPWFTSVSDTVTPAAGGLIDTTDNTGLLSKRMYRVQQLTRSTFTYQPKLFPEAVPQLAYHFLGQTIVLSDASTGSTVVTYAYLPTRFTDLTTDNTVNPDYPIGHEAALVYLTAAWAMTKGDAESMAQIGRIADQAVDALLMHVARKSPTGALTRTASVKAALMRNAISAPEKSD